jgi:hypothetical protein
VERQRRACQREVSLEVTNTPAGGQEADVCRNLGVPATVASEWNLN